MTAAFDAGPPWHGQLLDPVSQMTPRDSGEQPMRQDRPIDHDCHNRIMPGRHYSPDGLVDMPGKKGPQGLSWDKAVQLYIRLDRNSAHSFRQIEEDPFERALLFSHEGTIPGDLCYLPFLHLMDILANSERLEAQMSRRR